MMGYNLIMIQCTARTHSAIEKTLASQEMSACLILPAICSYLLLVFDILFRLRLFFGTLFILKFGQQLVRPVNF
jgi:hypothetical protein